MMRPSRRSQVPVIGRLLVEVVVHMEVVKVVEVVPLLNRPLVFPLSPEHNQLVFINTNRVATPGFGHVNGLFLLVGVQLLVIGRGGLGVHVGVDHAPLVLPVVNEGGAEVVV
jgi:hypothetical protein